MVNISSDLAWALGLIPSSTTADGESLLPDFRDERGQGWFWDWERYEGPRRAVCITIIRLHDDNDDCA